MAYETWIALVICGILLGVWFGIFLHPRLQAMFGGPGFRRRMTEQQAWMVLENTPTILWSADAEGRLSSATGKGLESLGVDVRHFIGQSYEDIFYNFPRLKEDGRRALAGEDFSDTVEVVGRTFEIQFHPIKDRLGRILGLAGTATDKSEQKKALDVLHQQGQMHESVLAALGEVGEGFVLIDNGMIVYANDAMTDITGYSVAELCSFKSAMQIVAPSEAARVEARLKDRGVGREVARRNETVFQRKDGGQVDVEAVFKEVGNEANPMHLILAKDITGAKKDQRDLRESEDRYRGLISSAFDGVAIHDGEKILSANRNLQDMFGYGEGELENLRLLDIFTPGSHEVVEGGLKERSQCPSEVQGLKKDGTTLDVEVCSKACAYEGQPAYISAMRDISERKRAEVTIRHQAYHDALTGLPNRLLFKDHLELEMAHARRDGKMLSVIMLDLDRFKIINDTLGHARGDQLVKAVAERLATCLREGDSLARLGGDSFGLLLPQVQRAEDAVKMAREIMKILQPAFKLEGQEVHITTSLGISLYPADGEEPEALMKNTDTALYRAKEQGRNHYQLYTSAMNARAFERLSFENGLRHALERDELVLYFQPLVDLRTGKVFGTEALVRWRHPDLGMIFPESFISLAEETGLIIPIGEWVTKRACQQLKEWKAKGHKLRMAVNLSALQFEQDDLGSRIGETMREAGLEAGDLELEITESVAMRDLEYTQKVLDELKAMGVRVAIDDFGTGHSSLSYLKRFPIDTLKIDRSFVRDIPHDNHDTAIVRAILALAESLELSVIAEGVETEEQLEFLKKQKCQGMQGYLFSPPVPAKELEQMLKEHKALPKT